MKFEPQYRGIIRLESVEYGRSVLGAPLLCYPSREKCRLLVFAGIHGEEPETTFLLSRAVRAFEKNFAHVAIVLCANPDGVALGTRGNANGVDLNRNFALDEVAAKKIRPQDKIIELIYTHLNMIRETVVRNGNLRAFPDRLYRCPGIQRRRQATSGSDRPSLETRHRLPDARKLRYLVQGTFARVHNARAPAPCAGAPV